MKDVMYMVIDEHMDYIVSIVSDLDDAMMIARRLNHEDDSRYHYYVVMECSWTFGESWLAAWEKVMNK